MGRDINSIVLVSYNCFSIRKRIDSIRSILKTCDILACQETVLPSQFNSFLHSIDNDFDVLITPSKISDESVCGIDDGRPKGGMAIFYRRSLNLDCDLLFSTENFMFARVSCQGFSFVLANVYLPCDSRSLESLIEYRRVLGELQASLDGLNDTKVVLIGVYNADPNKGRFWPELSDFVDSNFFKVNDLHLPLGSFTYLSPAHNTTSWLDHVISSRNVHIYDVEILYDQSLYDHFPVAMRLYVEGINYCQQSYKSSDLITELVDWKHFSREDKICYNNAVSSSFADIIICDDSSCRNDHVDCLENNYFSIVNALKSASARFKYINRRRFSPVPGWNNICKEKYSLAREALKLWISNDRIRSGAIYNNMQVTRRAFKQALKNCRQSEERIRNENLAKFLVNQDMNNYWKSVRSRRGNISVEVSSVDGVKGDYNISEVFREKFSRINGVAPESSQFTTSNSFYEERVRMPRLTNELVKNACNKLKSGLDHEGLHSNHVKFLNDDNLRVVKMFLNSCLIHGYFPKPMLNAVITPRIKNKYDDLKSSSNYREKMISSTFLKLFEYCILPYLTERGILSPLQFAYRSSSSTMLATALLKEAIGKYITQGSYVYACFMDMSKAFERVNHDTLLQKLVELNLSPMIVRALSFMLKNSTARVNYKDAYSESWTIKRGVRQGGITSAYLFCIYIDHVLTGISRVNSACRIGISKMNVLGYADDIVVFAPTSTGLRELLENMEGLVSDLELAINVAKTKVVVFRPKGSIYENELNFEYNGESIEMADQYKYLGVSIQSDLSEKCDIQRVTASFNKSVGMFLRSFGSCDIAVKWNLFNHLCTSFYGAQLWVKRRGNVALIKQLAISYHFALKKVLGFPKWASNHFICSMLRCLNFRSLSKFEGIKVFIMDEELY